MNPSPSILPTPQLDPSPPNLQTPEQKSNHLLMYILVLTIGIISLFILGWVYFNFIQKLNTKSINNFPVSTDNPYLKDIKLSHIFTGQLLEVRSTPKGQQLITNIEGEGIPDFIIEGSATKILIVDSYGKLLARGVQDLRRGDQLELYAYYDKDKRWSLTLVKAIRTSFENSPISSPASAKPLQ
jgi:hypothetical protein